MDFDVLLNQVREFLQRQGRVSYRALKLRFNLDDEVLAALKDELIYAQHVAQDEDDRVLVWAEEAGTTPEPARQPSVQQPPGTVRVEPRPAEAERRQLTVLFCDLVDSTALASQLDPEDWREVVRAYQETCAKVIARYEGHIAQYLGDGLLVYFGYPQAHEDDAQRAVRAGLEMVEAMRTLNTRLARDKAVRLGVRLGIHTGLVVVGEIGGGDRQEQLALGDTPNVAARLQGLATPNSVLISAATHRLVQGYFTVEPLGPQTLKGVAAPVQVYRILGASAAQSRLEVAAPTGLTPLVGRDSEVVLLLERWAHSQEGAGQVVLLHGEAGIGKSRLVEVLHERVISAGATRMVFRCSPYHQNSALYPVIDHLQRFLQWQRDDTPGAKFETLERMLQTSRVPLEDVVPLFAALLSVPMPERYPPLQLTPQRQRQKTQEAIVAWVLEEAERQPVLAVWEDLHWADPSTLDVLSLLLDQVSTARMLTLLTCRPEFRPPWVTHAPVTQVTLTRLGRAQVEAMLPSLTGRKALPPEIVEQVIAKTDGVPLFVEELVKMIMESGLVREQADRYALTGPLPPLAIPSTLHDSLMARLDRLATARALVQLGAVLGREFPYDLLQAVAPMEEIALQEGLAQLVAAQLVYQRGLPPRSRYSFKHALIQDAAYQSLLRSTRQRYHQRIAHVLAERFPETAATQPELLAYHYTEAGLAEQAMPYWQRAGQRAIEHSAYREAVAHLTQGLEVLTTLPDTPERAQHELDLQITLGPALMVTKGFTDPEVERLYTRAHTLCQQLGESPQLFPALWGLWRFYVGRGELQSARELGEQLLVLAECGQDPMLLVQACHALGPTLFWLGELVPAQARFAQAIAHYAPQLHRASVRYGGHDPGTCCQSYAAWSLCVRGYPDQALHQQQEALRLAQELAHPYTLICALDWGAWLHQFRREGQVTQAQAETAMPMSSEHGFVEWFAHEQILRGWALAAQGQGEAGIAQMRAGLATWEAMGNKLYRPYQLLQLAEVHGTVGQAEEGLRVLAEARAAIPHREGRFYEAELWRLEGELRLALSPEPHPEAATWFHQALAVARRQQAKSLELRAAMSLARLWQQQGKRQDAHDLLAPIYGWFTEGFDTADLQEAKALLDELA